MRRSLFALLASTALALPAFAAPNNPPPRQPISPQSQAMQPPNGAQNTESQSKARQAAPKSNEQAQSRQPSRQAANQTINPNRLSKHDVRRLQLALNKKGFDAGHVDGFWGPNTREAVRNFEKMKGLRPKGQLTRAAVSDLGLRLASNAASDHGKRTMYDSYRNHRK